MAVHAWFDCKWEETVRLMFSNSERQHHLLPRHNVEVKELLTSLDHSMRAYVLQGLASIQPVSLCFCKGALKGDEDTKILNHTACL